MRHLTLAAAVLLCALAAAEAGQHRNPDGSVSDDVLIQNNGQIIGRSNPLPATVLPAIGTLGDSAATQQSLAGLTAIEVRLPDPTALGEWFAQNQSAATLVLVLCNDAGTTTPCASRAGTYLVAPGAGAGQQGGSLGWQDTGPWRGRIDVYAASTTAQHTLTRQ